MDQEKYIKTRLDDQIKWYNKKSKCNQIWYKIIRIIEITLAGSIPLIIGIKPFSENLQNPILAIIGFVLVTMAGIIGLYDFQENWIKYRTTCESLKHNKYLFLSKAEPYNIDTSYQLLVSNVESLISMENSNWSLSKMKKIKKKKGD